MFTLFLVLVFITVWSVYILFGAVIVSIALDVMDTRVNKWLLCFMVLFWLPLLPIGLAIVVFSLFYNLITDYGE